jgi:bifunctional UDP-N-acetylglucosamine pyrophosphorylase/glucosamine-1-phosphate N-acetyltransferase
MLWWVVEAARAAGAARIACVVRPGSGVGERLPAGVEEIEQRVGEGTGAAVLAAREWADRERPLVLLSGDHPLVSAEVVRALVAEHAESGAAATLLTSDELDPSGYGRVVRGADGSVERIVETKHSEGVPDEILAIREVNIGI